MGMHFRLLMNPPGTLSRLEIALNNIHVWQDMFATSTTSHRVVALTEEREISTVFN